MTFEEWYNTSPLFKNTKDILRHCWDTAFKEGKFQANKHIEEYISTINRKNYD